MYSYCPRLVSSVSYSARGQQFPTSVVLACVEPERLEPLLQREHVCFTDDTPVSREQSGFKENTPASERTPRLHQAQQHTLKFSWNKQDFSPFLSQLLLPRISSILEFKIPNLVFFKFWYFHILVFPGSAIRVLSVHESLQNGFVGLSFDQITFHRCDICSFSASHEQF